MFCGLVNHSIFVTEFITEMISGKFAITVHILSVLSKYPEDYLSSEMLASSMNINPVLVRKEIANLKKHSLVESREGKYGGTRLAKPATDISLGDIFRITFEQVNLGYCKNTPNQNCPVGKKINMSLDRLYDDINGDINNKLCGVTLLQFAESF